MSKVGSFARTTSMRSLLDHDGKRNDTSTKHRRIKCVNKDSNNHKHMDDTLLSSRDKFEELKKSSLLNRNKSDYLAQEQAPEPVKL